MKYTRLIKWSNSENERVFIYINLIYSIQSKSHLPPSHPNKIRRIFYFSFHIFELFEFMIYPEIGLPYMEGKFEEKIRMTQKKITDLKAKLWLRDWWTSINKSCRWIGGVLHHLEPGPQALHLHLALLTLPLVVLLYLLLLSILNTKTRCYSVIVNNI